jgi:hypothetical protein
MIGTDVWFTELLWLSAMIPKQPQIYCKMFSYACIDLQIESIRIDRWNHGCTG